MDLLADKYTWLIGSFLIFIYILWKFGKEPFLAILDKRIADIKQEIETAETLRIEAQELLAQYQRKHRDAVKESDKIIQNAEKRAAAIRADTEKELDAMAQRREQQLQDRLKRMEADAIQDIKRYAADLTIEATKAIISEKMDKKTNDNLIKESIKTIGDRL